ncbi:MAG: helix-turn-helix domain-containing protein [Proteiniphilum sp.]|jgi:excisionase family DNA binding protein|uniref:helix-turn-helix domain-containing protein n=1 Tax=Proteiniphilum sp. TaxID=1926877 RepID=UPI002B21729D|nr:helix-turn-helix domain-containing protein [Proteiniphilum sp.]MEA5128320.1 helix-turn-helix domain-containing protein [Proteiniphilum sp.]
MSSNLEIQRICEWCNKLFIARTTTTRYCSHSCNSKAYKNAKREERKKQFEVTAIGYQTMQEIEQVSEKYETIKNKDFLTVSETAFLLSVGRTTIYRYLHSGTLSSFQTNGKTFIRRDDIDALFDNSEQYKACPSKDRKPITDLYTVSEIKEKFNVTDSWIFKIAKENNIPKTLSRGKSYFSKKHIDRYFESRIDQRTLEVDSWYSVEEIQEKYNLSRAAIYSFVSENNIPRKKEGRYVLYSQPHFDLAKGFVKPEYYSVEEAMQKYDLTRDALYHYLTYHNIPKIKEGRYIKISKPELDKLFEIQIT